MLFHPPDGAAVLTASQHSVADPSVTAPLSLANNAVLSGGRDHQRHPPADSDVGGQPPLVDQTHHLPPTGIAHRTDLLGYFRKVTVAIERLQAKEQLLTRTLGGGDWHAHVALRCGCSDRFIGWCGI